MTFLNKLTLLALCALVAAVASKVHKHPEDFHITPEGVQESEGQFNLPHDGLHHPKPGKIHRQTLEEDQNEEADDAVLDEDIELRTRQEDLDIDDEEIEEIDSEIVGDKKKAIQGWTTCDFAVLPRKSCEDCTTQVICTGAGGLLKPCTSPFKRYCNNGICSAVPAAGC